MCGSERWNLPLGLSPGGGVPGMSMDDSAQSFEHPVENKVRGQVGGGTEGTFHELSVQVGHDQIAGCQI